VLFRLRSVYEVATLHSCDDPSGSNPVILNHTILGSANSNGHDGK
jgi:hypothetical protein